MRLALIALILQIPRIQAGNDWILCIHPDGNGFLELPGSDCCRPCDSGKTHCGADPSSSEGDLTGDDTHCEDFPLSESSPAFVSQAQSRPAEPHPVLRPEAGTVGGNPGSPSCGGSLPCPGTRDPAQDPQLTRLRSVVIRW